MEHAIVEQVLQILRRGVRFGAEGSLPMKKNRLNWGEKRWSHTPRGLTNLYSNNRFLIVRCSWSTTCSSSLACSCSTTFSCSTTCSCSQLQRFEASAPPRRRLLIVCCAHKSMIMSLEQVMVFSIRPWSMALIGYQNRLTYIIYAKHIRFTNVTKYELWDLYKIQNKRFLDFSISFFRTFRKIDLFESILVLLVYFVQ